MVKWECAVGTVCKFKPVTPICEQHPVILITMAVYMGGGMGWVLNLLWNSDSHMQGVWNRRKIQLTRPALQYDYKCFADVSSLKIRNICLMYNYRVYHNLFWIFLLLMEYRLQSMYNHMVERSTSVISPFYFIRLAPMDYKYIKF